MADLRDHQVPPTTLPALPAISMLENGIELAPGIRVPPAALRIQFSRSGGPGGQNVNKLNTKAELWLRLDQLTGLNPRALARLRAAGGRRVTKAGEMHLTSESKRTADANRSAALARLREMIVAAMIEPKARRKTRPSRSSKLRRLESKRHRSGIKSGRRSQSDT